MEIGRSLRESTRDMLLNIVKGNNKTRERTITTVIANMVKNKIILITTTSNKKCYKNMEITSRNRRTNSYKKLISYNMLMDIINININKNASIPSKKYIKN